MKVMRTTLEGGVQGVLLASPARAGDWGVLLLAGSSGRVDEGRATLLAEHGALVLAQRWFGGPGQAPAICEIPLESFGRAIDRLAAEGARRIALLGVSRGAEAALLTACIDPRIEAVFAFSPSAWSWGCIYRAAAGDRWIQSASWTRGGAALPFVAFDETAYAATPQTPPVRWLDMHLASLDAAGESAELARIPIERFDGELVLIAGADDHVWPSERSARELAARAGRPAALITHSQAGHRSLLPGETTPRSALNLHGGTDLADAALGRRAWAAIRRTLSD